MAEDTFLIEQIAYEKVDFDAVYDIEDGWLNQRFRFSGITTNLQEEGKR